MCKKKFILSTQRWTFTSFICIQAFSHTHEFVYKNCSLNVNDVKHSDFKHFDILYILYCVLCFVYIKKKKKTANLTQYALSKEIFFNLSHLRAQGTYQINISLGILLFFISQFLLFSYFLRLLYHNQFIISILPSFLWNHCTHTITCSWSFHLNTFNENDWSIVSNITTIWSLLTKEFFQ